MNEVLYTLSQIAKQGIHVAGKEHHYDFLKKIIRITDTQPDGEIRNFDAYTLQTLEDALNRYQVEFGDGRKGRSNEGDEEYGDLRKIKIRKEIETLERGIEQKDLIIEQLKNRLIDYEEGYKYMATRKAIENAILRRILLLQVPITIPGLDKPKARTLGEKYYNKIQSVCNETVSIWQRKYETDDEFEKQIEAIIKKILYNETEEISQTLTESSNTIRPESLPTNRPTPDTPVGGGTAA